MKNAAVAALLALGMMLGACGVSDEEQPAPPTSSTDEIKLEPEQSGLSAFDVAKKTLDAESDSDFDYSTVAVEPALSAFRDVAKQTKEKGLKVEGKPEYSGETSVAEDLEADPARVEITMCANYSKTKLVDAQSGEDRTDESPIEDYTLQRFRLIDGGTDKGWLVSEWRTEGPCNG